MEKKSLVASRLNKYIQRIIKDIVIPRSTKAISYEMIVQNIHSYLGVIATTQRLSMYRANRNKEEKMITYYAMTFAPSSSGKSHTYNLMQNDIFGWYETLIKNMYRLDATTYNDNVKEQIAKKISDGVDSLGIAYKSADARKDLSNKLIQTDYRSSGLKVASATAQAISARRASLNSFDRFGIRIIQDELSTLFKSQKRDDTYRVLLETWEDGSMEVDGTKAEQVDASEYIPTSFTGYTAEGSIFKDDKIYAGLKDMLDIGLARRTHIVYLTWDDFSSEEIPNEENPSEEAIAKLSLELKDNISKLLISLKRTEAETTKAREAKAVNHGCRYSPMEFSSDAMGYMKKFSTKITEETKKMHDKSESYKASYAGMDVKAEKLAGIYAMIDGRNVINTQDCEEAIYWCELTQRHQEFISKKPTDTELLFDAIKKKQDWVSSFEIERLGIFSKSFDFNKKLDSTLSNLNQLCSVENQELIVSNRDGGTILKTRRIPLVELSNMRTSFMVGDWENIKKQNNGWNGGKFDFDDIHRFICGEHQGGFTACEFIDGIRKDINATGLIQFIALDFDDGSPSWEEALKEYSGYEYFAYTSRSHQKDKNGIKCDRFRILLPLERELKLTPEEFKRMYTKIAKIVTDDKCDTACKNIGRIFFNNPNGDYVYNDGARFKAHYFLEDKKSEKVYTPNASSDGTGLRAYYLDEVDIVNTSRTGGIKLLVKAAYATKNELDISSKNEATAYVKDLANQIFDEYWDRHNLKTEVLGILDKVYDNKG